MSLKCVEPSAQLKRGVIPNLKICETEQCGELHFQVESTIFK